jgi:hypothetical protein
MIDDQWWSIELTYHLKLKEHFAGLWCCMPCLRLPHVENLSGLRWASSPLFPVYGIARRCNQPHKLRLITYGNWIEFLTSSTAETTISWREKRRTAYMSVALGQSWYCSCWTYRPTKLLDGFWSWTVVKAIPAQQMSQTLLETKTKRLADEQKRKMSCVTHGQHRYHCLILHHEKVEFHQNVNTDTIVWFYTTRK